MELVKCAACGHEVSPLARACPACGHPKPRRKTNPNLDAAKFIFILLAFVGLVWFYFGGGLKREADHTLQGINDKVASDAEAQYEIAAKQGDRTAMCVQAGFVAAAYLQAQNASSYDTWKSTEKLDCQLAGVPR